MKMVLVVGKKFSGLTDYLDAHGYDWILLRDIKTTKYPDKKLKRRVVCDFSNAAEIEAALQKLKKKPDAVMVTYEQYVLPAAFVAEKLGLPGMTKEAAEACTDKYLMRSKLAMAPEKISPDFAEVGNEADLIAFAETHDFPLILKPANLAKSLLVTKSADMEELIANYRKSLAVIDEVYAKYSPNRVPKLIVEEFLEGSVYSVDAFIDADGTPHVIDGIVDYQTGYDVGYDDNFHYSRLMPTQLPEEKKQDLLRCAEIGCRALGMRSSPAHIEIIMTADGPRVVEIGARNGGYRERMYDLAQGIDITKNALAIAMNESTNIKARKNDSVAVLELFPKAPGVFVGIKNEEELRTLPSFSYLSIKAKIGEYVGKAGDGYKMCAVVILNNSDELQFREDLDFVNEKVFAETEDE